jgi:hypothetical protein
MMAIRESLQMLGIIVAALMAASFFMPWVVFFGESRGPQVFFDDRLEALLNGPWQLLVFLGSFAVAALAVLVAVVGRAAGLLMLLAGAIPYGLIAQQVLSVRDQVQDAGFPLPRLDDPVEAFQSIRELLEIGAPIYFISAALLVVVGLARLVRGA